MINKDKLKKIATYFKSKKMETQLFINYIFFLIILIAIFTYNSGSTIFLFFY